MNRKMIEDKYFNKFIYDRLQKITDAIVVCKTLAVKYPEVPLGSFDLEYIFRIRSMIPSGVFPAAVIYAVGKNPLAPVEDIFDIFIDYIFEFRAHMAGCCYDCWENVYDIDEYSFVLHKKIWNKAAKKQKEHFLCIECIEDRLKRELEPEDFNWEVPLNGPDEIRSKRLESRMYGEDYDECGDC
jgi:hypothetical protein